MKQKVNFKLTSNHRQISEPMFSKPFLSNVVLHVNSMRLKYSDNMTLIMIYIYIYNALILHLCKSKLFITSKMYDTIFFSVFILF